MLLLLYKFMVTNLWPLSYWDSDGAAGLEQPPGFLQPLILRPPGPGHFRLETLEAVRTLDLPDRV